MRVLLIDDEHMVRKIIRKMIERAGYDVVDVEDGRVGLDLLKDAPFDFVLTDIIMPEVEGIEVLTTVAKQFPATKVIAMSGGGRTGNIDFLEVAGKLGASAILHKPFSYDILLSAFDQSLKTQIRQPSVSLSDHPLAE